MLTGTVAHLWSLQSPILIQKWRFVRLLLAAGIDPNLPKINLGGEEETLLSYLDRAVKLATNKSGQTRADYREDIILLLKKADAPHQFP